MRAFLARAAASILAAMAALQPHAALAGDVAGGTCAAPKDSLGVSRIVEIDTSTGALFGSISKQAREPRFLEPKEIVLTFDDGPLPAVTKSILDTLDRFCTKATFFEVGQMAIAYPGTVKSVIEHGHTVGSHTWSHPLNLRHLSVEKATEEIEKGYAAVTLGAGQPVAPFFRFPGLSDSASLLAHLQQRGIASFTVDAVSNDSYISDSDRLLQHALKEVDEQKGGIVLFHDIKAATARMLPRFLAEIKARGYSIVHMRAKGEVAPLQVYTDRLVPVLAKAAALAAAHLLVPFYGVRLPQDGDEPSGVVAAAAAETPVAAIVPAAKPRDERKMARAQSRPAATSVHGWSARTVDTPDAR